MDESVARVATIYYLRRQIFNKKIMRHAKEQESVTHIREKKNQATETAFERAHMSDLTKASKQLLQACSKS